MTQSAIDLGAGSAHAAFRASSHTVTPWRLRRRRAEPELPVARRGRLVLAVAIAGALYLLDLATKAAAVAMLEQDVPVRIAGTGVSLHLVRNPGAAFGIGVDMTWLFTGITALVVLAILRVARRLGSLPWAVALGLLLGGALGNLTDRLARSPGFLHGQVVDFVGIGGLPVFNVADVSICLAGMCLVALVCRSIPIEGGPVPEPVAGTAGAGRHLGHR